MTRTIAIIGAGMAGLACASRLEAAGIRVVLFDKARGPGGRMSTRRVDTSAGQVSFDHGAQYFTARGAAFREQVEAWAADGIVAPWPAAGPEAWVGTPGMNAPVRALAARRAVTFSHQVETLIPDGAGWRLVGPNGPTGPFDAVLLAMPAEQTAALLTGVEPSMARVAAASVTDPCWTVMAAFGQRLAIDADTLRDQGPLGWAARNASKPGRAPVEAWVMQGSPEWSRRHLEDPAGDVCKALLEGLRRCSGGPIPEPIAVQAHRWRFARSAAGDERALWSPAAGIGCCGDWLIGPRVECAWDSGEALAERVIGDL
jgi:renalase